MEGRDGGGAGGTDLSHELGTRKIPVFCSSGLAFLASFPKERAGVALGRLPHALCLLKQQNWGLLISSL